MITIDEYIQPGSVGEAFQKLSTSSNAAIIGGGVFMRMASRKISLAIDLSRAGLDFIREAEAAIEIGAMTTFRELERSAVLRENLGGIIPNSVSNIGGVQLRNMVTVGGTVYGRYGFSEFLTGLMVLNADVELYHHGTIPLNEFITRRNIRDVLVKLTIAKQSLKASYQMFRNSSGSLPILCVAVSRNGPEYKIAVGARPGIAGLAYETMNLLRNAGELSPGAAENAGNMAARELEFGNDRKASAAYRKELCKVLVKRALLEVQG